MIAHGRVTLKPLAVQDLSRQFDYLSEGAWRRRRDFSMRRSPHSIGCWIHPAPVLRTFRSRASGIRRWPIPEFPKHLIFYRPTDDGVDILRVLHGARDVGKTQMESAE
jgi:toxin ParE1/3/4